MSKLQGRLWSVSAALFLTGAILLAWDNSKLRDSLEEVQRESDRCLDDKTELIRIINNTKKL